jgi:hypothetical protein
MKLINAVVLKFLICLFLIVSTARSLKPEDYKYEKKNEEKIKKVNEFLDLIRVNKENLKYAESFNSQSEDEKEKVFEAVAQTILRRMEEYYEDKQNFKKIVMRPRKYGKNGEVSEYTEKQSIGNTMGQFYLYRAISELNNEHSNLTKEYKDEKKESIKKYFKGEVIFKNIMENFEEKKKAMELTTKIKKGKTILIIYIHF